MMPQPQSLPLNILLVEDSPADARLLKEAIREARLNVELTVVDNGEDALSVLRREASHARAPRPDVLIVDLMLPKVGGAEIIQVCKEDPELRNLLVVVLSLAPAAEATVLASQLPNGHYIRKPMDLESTLAIGQRLRDLWLEHQMSA